MFVDSLMEYIVPPGWVLLLSVEYLIEFEDVSLISFEHVSLWVW